MSPRGWASLAAHIAAHPVEGPAPRMRRCFDALAPDGPAGRIDTSGGVPCRRFGTADGRPVVWAHGGGLVFGSARSHAAAADALAQRVRRPVIVPDYRLAPEHLWPNPLIDLLAVIDCLGAGVDLVGDSAGGFLALTAALRRPGRIGRLALISPNTDRTGQSRTRVPNTPSDLMNDDARDLALARMAFGGNPAAIAEASPLNAVLAGLPPVWLTVATDEVLLDDSLLLIRALALAGVDVTTEIRSGLCHLWMLWPDALDATARSYDGLAAFLAAPH